MRINLNILLIIIQQKGKEDLIMAATLDGELVEIHLQCNLFKIIFYRLLIKTFQLIF